VAIHPKYGLAQIVAKRGGDPVGGAAGGRVDVFPVPTVDKDGHPGFAGDGFIAELGDHGDAAGAHPVAGAGGGAGFDVITFTPA